jgi:hypothetical protein
MFRNYSIIVCIDSYNNTLAETQNLDAFALGFRVNLPGSGEASGVFWLGFCLNGCFAIELWVRGWLGECGRF